MHVSLPGMSAIAHAMPIPMAAPPARPPAPPHHPLSAEQEHLHHLINELIALNRRVRKGNPPEWAKHEPADAYAYHCGTVHCQVGRQTGNTSYIAFNANPGDLVVTLDKRDAEIRFRGAPFDVITAADIKRRYDTRSRLSARYQNIYIDEPAAVFSIVNRHELYFQLARDTDQTFILLGA